jgi:hypothetical protein
MSAYFIIKENIRSHVDIGCFVYFKTFTTFRPADPTSAVDSASAEIISLSGRKALFYFVIFQPHTKVVQQNIYNGTKHQEKSAFC